MTQGQLLLCRQANWYPLAAINQSQLLMFGEDLKDSLRLLRVMSAVELHQQDYYRIAASCIHVEQSRGSSPVPQVRMLHHPLIINQTCCRGNKGGKVGLHCIFLIARCADGTSLCTERRKREV